MKQIPIEFLEMVKNDIQRINAIIYELPDKFTLERLHREIDGRYQSCILNWGQSMWNYDDKVGFLYNSIDAESLYDNLSMIKSKLETYQYQVNAVPNMMPSSTNLIVNVANNIKIDFDSVRTKIDESPSLTAEQSREANDKIDEIEIIVKSNDSKKSKWEKAKPILAWLADKSVDIGTAFLPLLLKI